MEEHYTVTLKHSKASATKETYNTKAEKIQYKKIPRRNQTTAVANKSVGIIRKYRCHLTTSYIFVKVKFSNNLSAARPNEISKEDADNSNTSHSATNTTTAYTRRTEGSNTMEVQQKPESQEWETVMRLMIFYKATKIMSFRDMVKILNNCQVIYFFLE